MLQHAVTINNTIKGLGAIVDNQAPVFRFLIRNWPITAIIGMAYAGQMHKRWKKKDLNPFTAVTDAGMVLLPMVALFTIQQLARDDKTDAALAAKVAALSTPGPQTKGVTPLPIQGTQSPLSGLGGAHVVERLA